MASAGKLPFPSGDSSSQVTEPQTSFEHAMRLLNEGKLDESESVFRSLISLSNRPADGFYGLGVIQAKRGSLSDAVVSFRNSVALDPHNVNAYSFLGDISEKLRQPEQALQFFSKALEIDPSQTALRNRVERLSAQLKVVTSVQEDPSATVEQYGIYEYIQKDPSPLAKQTISLIDSLTVKAATPRLSASIGSILLTLVASFVIPFFLYILLVKNLIPMMYPIRSVNHRVVQSPIAQSATTLIVFASIALGILLIAKVVTSILKVKTTTITIDKGRLQITKGILSREQQNYELYRVQDIELHQSFVNRLTHDGTLALHIVPGRGEAHLVKISGLSSIDELRIMFDRLRNLILLLRSGTWGKGVIY